MSVERYKIGKGAVGNLEKRADAGKWASGDLVASDETAGILSWQNPESSKIIVLRMIIDVTTEPTGGCSIDVGTDADGTGSSGNLIDDLPISAGADVYDNLIAHGIEGRAGQHLDEKGGTTGYITATKTSGATAGLVGKYYIYYRTV